MSLSKALFLLGVVFLSCTLIGASSCGFETRRSLLLPVPKNGPAIFYVTKFGAVADDKTDNIDAFRAAWGEACRNSTTQAKVLIPAGTFRAAQTMFAGPCTSPKPITIEVIGTVSPEWFSFLDIDGLVLTGNGVFGGQGAATWPYNDCKKTKGNCAPLPSQHLKITAPGNSPDTDGMHISTSDRIKVFNCACTLTYISIGYSTTDIAITNITCAHSHGVSIGSLGKWPEERSVNGISVTNCTFLNTTNGARIKTWMGTVPAEAKNIAYEGLIMKGVQNPIVIDQSYGFKKKSEFLILSETHPSSSVWKISNIHFRKIQGTTVSNVAVSLQCSTSNPCEGVEIADVDLAYAGRPHNTSFVSSCSNAKTIFGGILNPPAC
uniref:Uncharacterized protein n=1 Tax=Glycine max TaxID=3847 RepID=K7LGW5_SOYBN